MLVPVLAAQLLQLNEFHARCGEHHFIHILLVDIDATGVAVVDDGLKRCAVDLRQHDVAVIVPLTEIRSKQRLKVTARRGHYQTVNEKSATTNWRDNQNCWRSALHLFRSLLFIDARHQCNITQIVQFIDSLQQSCRMLAVNRHFRLSSIRGQLNKHKITFNRNKITIIVTSHSKMPERFSERTKLRAVNAEARKKLNKQTKCQWRSERSMNRSRAIWTFWRMDNVRNANRFLSSDRNNSQTKSVEYIRSSAATVVADNFHFRSIPTTTIFVPAKHKSLQTMRCRCATVPQLALTLRQPQTVHAESLNWFERHIYVQFSFFFHLCHLSISICFFLPRFALKWILEWVNSKWCKILWSIFECDCIMGNAQRVNSNDWGGESNQASWKRKQEQERTTAIRRYCIRCLLGLVGDDCWIMLTNDVISI